MRRLPPRPVRRAADAAVAAARHVPLGRMPSSSRRAQTRSAKSGASASLVGQPTSRRPCSARKALSGRNRLDCAGSARSTRKVAHCAWPRSIQGSSFASSRRASAICAASSRATPSASAMSPPRYQTDWPSRVGWVVTVIRGFGPAPRQWAYSGFRVAALTITMCSGRRCMAGCSRPSSRSSASLPAPALEHHALGTDLPAVDAQAGQFPAFAQRFDALAGEQAVAGQFRQAANQVGDVEDDFREAVGLALEPLVAQRRRQILALGLLDPAAHRLAGEEAGKAAGQAARRPQVVRLGKQAVRPAGRVRRRCRDRRASAAACRRWLRRRRSGRHAGRTWRRRG